MAASHASKGPKLDKSAGTFAGILKIEKNQNSLWQGFPDTIRFPPPELRSAFFLIFFSFKFFSKSLNLDGQRCNILSFTFFKIDIK